jgi:DNA-binding MarR family transcriptional regulator
MAFEASNFIPMPKSKVTNAQAPHDIHARQLYWTVACNAGLRMLARQTTELLIQAARAAHAGQPERIHGPAEWRALRFLARANARSRTPSALAAFEASSRAAISHVVGRLAHEGYLTRVPSPDDRRCTRLDVTPKGRAALRRDPVEALVEAIRSLEGDAREALHGALRQLLRDLAASGARRQFDVCRACAHFSVTVEDPPHTRQSYRCGRFHSTVDDDAADLLCAHFASASG